MHVDVAEEEAKVDHEAMAEEEGETAEEEAIRRTRMTVRTVAAWAATGPGGR